MARVDERSRWFAIRGVTALLIVVVVAAALACERLESETPTSGPRSPAEQFYWGRQYLYGPDLPKDEAQAAHWFRKAAEKGHAGAQFELGMLYAKGVGVPENQTEAARWLREAAEQGHAKAAWEMSRRYAEGRGVPKSDTDAAEWVQRAAELGNVRAMFVLGKQHREGAGVPRDAVRAHMWFNLARALGSIDAKPVLSRLERDLTPERIAEAQRLAREWWAEHQVPAETPPATAADRFALGMAYAAGEGVPQDEAYALKWLREAAEEGHSRAQRELAVRLGAGRGTAAYDAEAVEWLRRAAEQGDARAQLRLGLCYRDGRGVPADAVRAHLWLSLGAGSGSPGAARALARLEKNLSEAQIAAARRLAAERATTQERDASEPWLFEIVDEAEQPTPVRVSLWSEDGASLHPRGLRAYVDPFDVHYFYTNGRFQLFGDHETVRIRIQKGFEYRVVDRRVDRADGPARLRLERLFDMKKRGYYSGDGHIHPNFGSPQSHLGNRTLLEWMKAEDLNVANLLAGNLWDARIFLADRVTGRTEPESEPDFLLRVSEEYRSAVYGHMSVYGVRRLSNPLFTGFRNTPYPYDFPTNYEAARKYAEDGAFPSYAHLQPPLSFDRPNEIPAYVWECPVDIALGALNAVEIQGYAVNPESARPIWEGLMSAGFDIVVTAGTDSYPGQPVSGVMGFARSYVDMGDLPFSYEAWSSRLAQGRGFTTNGPLVFLSVDGRNPGETLRLEPGETRRVGVEVVVDSVFPWDWVSVRSNLEEALVFPSDPAHPPHQTFRGSVRLSGPAWLYARVSGGSVHEGLPGASEQSRPIAAITNAIWVTRGAERRRHAASLEYFVGWVKDNLAVLEQRNNYGSPENREVVRKTFLRALEIFEQRLAEARESG